MTETNGALALAQPAEPSSLVMPLITPKLQARIEEYNIEMPACAPVFDRIFIYPTDKADQPDTTAGGIVLPDTTKTRMGAQRGVLIMAGPKAVEELYSHGITVGHIVLVARFSPWDRVYFSRSGRMHRMMVLRAAEVVGSEDLLRAYESGELRMEMTPDGRVALHDRERIDPPTNDEGV